MNEFDYQLVLNRVSQQVIALDESTCWFNSLGIDERRRVVQLCFYMAFQAGANVGDVSQAVAGSNVKPTATPAVVLSTNLRYGMPKVVSLPETDLETSYRLVVSLYSIADQRRRERCSSDCKHWWHRDLSNEAYVDELRQSYLDGKL